MKKTATPLVWSMSGLAFYAALFQFFLFKADVSPVPTAPLIGTNDGTTICDARTMEISCENNAANTIDLDILKTNANFPFPADIEDCSSEGAAFQTAWVTFNLTPNTETEWRLEVMGNRTAHWALYRADNLNDCDADKFNFVACGNQTMGPWVNFPDDGITTETTYFLAMYSPTNLTENLNDLNIKLRKCGQDDVEPCDASAGNVTVGDETICEGTNASLDIMGAEARDGYVSYVFVYDAYGKLVASVNSFDVNSLEDDFASFEPGKYSIYAYQAKIAEDDGCFDDDGGFEVPTTLAALLNCSEGLDCWDISQQDCITVNENPEAEISGEGDLCVGSTLDLTGSPADKSNATYTVAWSASGNDKVITINDAGVITAVGAGEAKVTYTVTNKATGCADTEEVVITVRANPGAGMVLRGPAASCEDDGSVIKVVISATGGKAPYNISFGHTRLFVDENCKPVGNGPAATTIDEDGVYELVFTGFPAGVYSVNAEVSDANGCSAPALTNVGFTINAKPVGENATKTIRNCSEVNFKLQNQIKCDLASTFSWYSVASIGSGVAYNNPNVEGETINPAGTGASINDFLTNTSAVNQTIIYRVIPTSVTGACTGEPFYISITVRPREVIDCVACMSQVNVSLDKNCTFKVLPDHVMDFGRCASEGFQDALEVFVSDGSNNDNIITCAGTYTYIVRLKKGYEKCFAFEPCWGKITAEDKTAPELICPPADFTLDCYDVNYVLNNKLTIGNVGALKSPKSAATGAQTILNAEGVKGTDDFVGDNCDLGLVPPGLTDDKIKNLGYAYFKDNCRDCGCRVTLKWSDKVVFYSCVDAEFKDKGYYARISREWVATDCNGMSSSYTQDIFFTRPVVKNGLTAGANDRGLRFRGKGTTGASATVPAPNYDWVVEYSSCTADKSLIKKADVTPSFCSFFNIASDNPRCLLIDEIECNYSVSIKDTEFPICNGKGVKIDRELSVFDWCAGGIVETFHILIKIGDFTPPTLIAPTFVNGAPYNNPEQLPLVKISTGPMDCTASFPVSTAAAIKNTFGYEIKDNCSLANVSVSVYTKDTYVKGILVGRGPRDPFRDCPDDRKPSGYRNHYDDDDDDRDDDDDHGYGGYFPKCEEKCIAWKKVDYAIMNGNMIGVPVGRHLMVIEAFDGCYNSACMSFEFAVEDKIAPVMKCDDQLHISLSNGNGYTTGYAQASAEDIDEGSWDNCKLAWIAVRRNVPTGCEKSFIDKGYDTNGNGKLDPLPADGDSKKADGFDRNGDGDLADFGETFILKGGKLMTPLQDQVEFFCCDLTALVTVELWGADTADNPHTDKDETNYNFCWDELLIEDKVAPTCVAPWPLTVDCDEKCLEKIDDKKASALCFGDVTINSGNDCAPLDTVYTVEKDLKCGYGTITRKWALTKQTAKGPITINCSQTITVLPVHEYNICFPKDATADCKTPIVDTVITDELGCDILAVNVNDKRYDASNDECYKIFRTYTVINWCTFSDECEDASDLGGGDPGNSYGFVVDRGTFGNYGKKPLYVLVRDEDSDDEDGEIYISEDLEVDDDDEAYTFDDELYYCEETEDYYQVFQYTQIIKVYDDVRPVVTGTPGKFCIQEGGDCLADLKMVITGKDNCSDKVTLETQFLMIAPFQTLKASEMIMYSTPKWSHVDKGNGDFEISVTDLPQGKHDLIVVVRDECGNLSVPTRIPFTVEDCKGPAPICINGLSTDLMSDGNNGGMMAVWASDFVASKIYDCNGQGPETQKDNSKLKLVTKYSINRVGEAKDKSKTGLNLTCADKGKVVLVELHAWDEAGNDDFCVTYIEVQDNNKVCPGSVTGTASIAGTISTEGSANLQGATITLSGAASQTATSTANGGYSFVSLAKGSDFTVTPQLDKNHLNGVSTFDLVLIQKHILNVQALNSPYKMIAADVNNSKSITTLDLIALRKLILNIDQTFQNNTSWRFVDAAYKFPNASNPWAATFPEVANINNLTGTVNAGFIAVKVGDVNASATVSAATAAEVRTAGTLDINAAEAALKAGQEYSVEFNAADLKNVQGYQFALNLDKSKVELVDIVYGVAKAENFGVFTNEGIITTSWNQGGLATATAKQGALFTLVLRAKADAQLSNTLSLNRVVSAEAYNGNNDQLNVALKFNAAEVATGFELKQNTPNPFNGETLINFNLPKATAATLTISDVTGRILKSVRANYAKGMNQVTLKASDLNATGVLYYTLEADDFTATKKMIIVE